MHGHHHHHPPELPEDKALRRERIARNAAVLLGFLTWMLIDAALAKWKRHGALDLSLLAHILLGFASVGVALRLAVQARNDAPPPRAFAAHQARGPQPVGLYLLHPVAPAA